MFDIFGAQGTRSNTKVILRSLMLWLSLGGMLFASSSYAQFGGGTTSAPPEAIVEWEKKQSAQDRLTPLGENLMGDKISPTTGSIEFEHTDIDIPGNSNLKVALTRRLTQGALYHSSVAAEFGDWEVVAPRIYAQTIKDIPWRNSNRCSGSSSVNFPPVQVFYQSSQSISGETPNWSQGGFAETVTTPVLKSFSVYPHEYSNGVFIDLPGHGAKELYMNNFTPDSANNAYPQSKGKYYARDGIAVNCLSSIDGAGEGFIAKSPNGNTYKFDKFYELQAKDMGFIADTYHKSTTRYRSIIAATEVTDVNGNWVKYEYDNENRLTRIHSNDGREIQIGYSGKLIVSATTNGRSWSYGYGSNTATYQWWGDSNTFPIGGTVLESVTRPDGSAWSFSLDAMAVDPVPAEACTPQTDVMFVSHPYGAVGRFTLADRQYRPSLDVMTTASRACPTPEVIGVDYEGLPTANDDALRVKMNFAHSVHKKEVLRDIQSLDVLHQWDFTYGTTHGASSQPRDQKTNWTEIAHAEDGKVRRYYKWLSEPLAGQVLSEEYKDTNDAIMQTVEKTYFSNLASYTVVGKGLFGAGTYNYNLLKENTIARDGGVYTTQYQYGLGFDSLHSYGRPTSISTFSNMYTTTPLTTVTTYEHNKNEWVLGLPKAVTTNGRNEATYVYDSLGRKTSETRYGFNYATYHYYDDGSLNWFRDARGKLTAAYDWKRGTPERVKRPDGTFIYQYVDDNGWLTRSKDARGYITNYSRDNMGRLTTYAPTSPWSATNISYSFGSTITQTITRSQAETEITYDTMFRPTLVKTSDLSTDNSTFVKTTYNGAGQTVFTSFPSSSSSPTDGTNMTYDGLGRILDSTENVAPYAKTKTRYLNHLTRVYDPAGYNTDYYYMGRSPNDKTLRAIYQGLSYTDFGYNVWGELTYLQQRKSGTYNVLQRHNYFYDNQRRLCRYSESEGGDTVYSYNEVGQIKTYQKGLPIGTNCSVPTGIDRVILSYDSLGRLETTNYADSNTPDISRTYDLNSNLLTLNREGVNWTYAYDSANHLKIENLTIDGREYRHQYYYNPDESLRVAFQPYNSTAARRRYSYTNDGLGRPTQISYISTTPANSRTYAQNMSYSASGAMTHMEYGNGQVMDVTLNNRLLPSRVYTRMGSNKAIDSTYTYDARRKVTNIVNAAISGDNRTFGYDRLGRMTSSTGPWGTGSYDYDGLGNIRTKTEGSRALVMNYDDNLNRLVSHTDTQGPTRTLEYDNRGNVSKLGGLFFTYDKSDQPTYISGTANGTYKYDGNFKRVKSVVDGKTIYNVYNAAGTLTFVDKVTDNKRVEYVGDIARIENGSVTTYLHKDHLGSANTATSENGLISWRQSYAPFGEELNTLAVNTDLKGFTGHIKDSATGLNYMQARYYDPMIGRFLSIDPVGFSPERPEMFGRYTYVGNDPINATDPTGMVLECASGRCQNEQGETIFKYHGNLKTSPERDEVGAAIETLSEQGRFESSATAVVRKSGAPINVGLSGLNKSGAGYYTKEEGGSNIGIQFRTIGQGYLVNEKSTQKLAAKNNSTVNDSIVYQKPGWFFKKAYAPMSLERTLVHELRHLSGKVESSVGGSPSNRSVIGHTNNFMMKHYGEPARKVTSHDTPFAVIR